MTGIGPVAVCQPRVRDCEADATDPDRIRFLPSILPPYMRRSKSIETLLPIPYLKGISTGDFSEALAALLSNDAAGLSASAIESFVRLLHSGARKEVARLDLGEPGGKLVEVILDLFKFCKREFPTPGLPFISARNSPERSANSS
ncbi:hypothetical protein ACVIJ6_003237 [Bradyrhizobium sp. USDA 4369]|jgi:hypothetical protein